MGIHGDPTLNEIRRMPRNAPKRREFEQKFKEAAAPLSDLLLKWVEQLSAHHDIPPSMEAFEYICEMKGKPLTDEELRTSMFAMGTLFEGRGEEVDLANLSHLQRWGEIRVREGSRRSSKRPNPFQALRAVRELSKITGKFTYAKLGDTFGVSGSTAFRWLNGGHLTNVKQLIKDIVEFQPPADKADQPNLKKADHTFFDPNG